MFRSRLTTIAGHQFTQLARIPRIVDAVAIMVGSVDNMPDR
jgi:hypothetical protein